MPIEHCTESNRVLIAVDGFLGAIRESGARERDSFLQCLPFAGPHSHPQVEVSAKEYTHMVAISMRRHDLHNALRWTRQLHHTGVYRDPYVEL